MHTVQTHTHTHTHTRTHIHQQILFSLVCVCVCVWEGEEGNESVFVCECVGVREWVLASRKKKERLSSGRGGR